MDKFELFGVEALTGEAGPGLFGPVDHISQQGVADGSHVHADLMGTAGFQTAHY